MKHTITFIAILAFLILVIPMLCVRTPSDSDKEARTVDDEQIQVYISKQNKMITLKLKDYLYGVVSAEMPMTFDIEALKAQAVAARTYTLNKIANAKYDLAHRGADMCDDFRHCQAYSDTDTLNKNWGENASSYSEKCKKAISATAGQIMTYHNEPVLAVFHSSSNGKTQNAGDVWGKNVAYLMGVDSPGETECPNHQSTVRVSTEDFKKKISAKYKVDFSKEVAGRIIRNDSGYVASISIGGVPVEGKEIRSLFGLRSSDFDVSIDGGYVIFNVVGNGHGVGMSQYGAKYMAEHGYNYRDILQRYYTGIKIEKQKSLPE